MPSSCDAASSIPGRRPRRPWPPALSSSPARTRRSRRASSPRTSPSSCSARPRPSWAVAVASSRPHWTGSRSPSPTGAPSMREPRPAASPTACSSAGRPTSTPWTSATGSSTPRCGHTPASTVLERTNVRTLTLAELSAADPAYEPCPLVVADLSFISLRSVVPALDRPRLDARRRPGPPGQAPVRGGPRRRLPGQGRDPGPRTLAGRARGRGVRAA